MKHYAVNIQTKQVREIITNVPLTPAEIQEQIDNIAALYNVDQSAVQVVEERRRVKTQKEQE